MNRGAIELEFSLPKMRFTRILQDMGTPALTASTATDGSFAP
jgi:hypothetical protein